MLELARIPANREKIFPKEYERLVPPKWMSISTLLSTHLPTISSTASVLPAAKSCVVSEPPRWTEDELMTMKIPSKEWLAALDTAIVEGWLRGIRSVRHPGNANIRLPLWVGTFWAALTEAVEEQRAWKRAQEWVRALPQNHQTHELQALLGRIPWKAMAWVLPAAAYRATTKVSFFANLLSDRLLAERHIDAFITYLNIRLRKERPGAPWFLIADLPFSDALSHLYNAPTYKFENCTILLQYIAVFKNNKAYRVLLFPAHVGGEEDGHWVVFCVDFQKHEYSYGEFCMRVYKWPNYLHIS